MSDIPAEIIDAANKALADREHHSLCGCDLWPAACTRGYGVESFAQDHTSLLIATAWPLIEAMVREEIADQFEGVGVMTNAELSDLRNCYDTDPEHDRCGEVWARYAARITRGNR